MAALATIEDYILESRRLLQDEISPYRYPDVDVIAALNLALMEARRLRADLFLPNFAVPLVEMPGTPVPFPEMYRVALVYYIVGHCQLRDDEATTDSRASALLQKFVAKLLLVPS